MNFIKIKKNYLMYTQMCFVFGLIVFSSSFTTCLMPNILKEDEITDKMNSELSVLQLNWFKVNKLKLLMSKKNKTKSLLIHKNSQVFARNVMTNNEV